MPVARQTTSVGGDQDQGAADGAANAEDFVSTFGVAELTAQGGQFIMVLDVEGNPDLTADYYTGWTQGLISKAQQMSGGAVQMLPCLYASHGDTGTWNALETAMNAGAPCSGVWVARYLNSLANAAGWATGATAVVTPTSPNPFSATILAWQYAENCPERQHRLLGRPIPPSISRMICCSSWCCRPRNGCPRGPRSLARGDRGFTPPAGNPRLSLKQL